MAQIESFLPFLETYGTQLAIIAAVFFGGRFLIRFVAGRIKKMADDGNDEVMTGREKRAATVAGLFTTAANVGLFLVLTGLVLNMVGVDAMTLLGAAGIVSFAVGFGTQSLVKDLIAGMFIMAENQFAVGDRVKINDKEGTVCRMSVRTTVLRTEPKVGTDGTETPGCYIFIANGGITSVCNYSLMRNTVVGPTVAPPAPTAAPAAPDDGKVTDADLARMAPPSDKHGFAVTSPEPPSKRVHDHLSVTCFEAGPFMIVVTDPAQPDDAAYPMVIAPEGGYATKEAAIAYIDRCFANRATPYLGLHFAVAQLDGERDFVQFCSWED
jgi:hypothetical protein